MVPKVNHASDSKVTDMYQSKSVQIILRLIASFGQTVE